MTNVSLALGVAGLAAASLVVPSPRFGGEQGVLWMFWLASLLVTIVVYAGTVNGALFLPSQVPALIDLALPFLLGISELVQFAILAYQASGLSSARSILAGWWMAIGIFGLVAAAAVEREWRLISRASCEPALDRLKMNYLESIRKDRDAAIYLGIFGVANGVVHAVLGLLDLAVNYGTSVLAITVLCYALYNHSQTAQRMRTEIANILSTA